MTYLFNTSANARFNQRRRARGIGHTWRVITVLLMLAGLVALTPVSPAQAAGVVGDGALGSCNEAAFDAALAGGGLVTFNCHPDDLPIVVTGQKVIAADTQIDGDGLVTLSGGNATRIFVVNLGITLNLEDITLSDGGGVNLGGAIDNAGGTVTITNSTITGNSATLGGGAILNAPTGIVSITHSTFSDNDASTGGAIYNDSGAVSITSSTFSDNSAGFNGGAIFNSPGATLDVTNSTLIHNSAGSNGGAIENASGTVTIVASTVVRNAAVNFGGGIFNGVGSTMTIAASIVAHNVAPIGPNCFDPGGAISSLGWNLSDDASCPFIQPTDIPNSASINLSPLADNGGPTQTMLPQLSSDAIDSAACLVVEDQRGEPRPSGPACDIGSVEIQQASKPKVTGGGWIDSPEGAYTADPSLTGKATFGFVARHKQGAAVPDGHTTFQFHAGSLKFKSSSYDSLIVAGSDAQFTGVGTIKGQGDYGFRLTATDDSPDEFRIQIWDIDNGNPVYDNGSDQALGGGSIVIHSK